MPLTWVPLLESALRDLAYEQGVFVAPHSRCMITDGPEMARFQDSSELDTTHYLVNAILCNRFSQTCDERAFLLPSFLPQESLANYSLNFDRITGIIHVTSRFRYVTLKELFLLQGTTSPARSIHIAEFSNGEVSAVRLPENVDHNNQGNIMQDPSQAHDTLGDSSVKICEVKNCSEIRLDHTIAAKNVSAEARKPFQEKGVGLTIDALASMQQALLDSAAHTRSSSSESNNGTISTPATSATSSKFPVPLNSPQVTAGEGLVSCAVSYSLGEDAVRMDMTQITLSAVQDMPSFDVGAKKASRCCEALDLIPQIRYDNLEEPLAHLDLAPPTLKELAYVIQKMFPLASPESPDVEITLDESSGELLDMLDLDALFGDDEDCDFQPVTPTVKLPTAAPVHTCMTLENAMRLNTLGLRQGLSKDTIEVLDGVNTYYREIWLERHKKRDTLPEDQPNYYEATYDEALQEQAVTEFEAYNSTIPGETLQLLQPFISAFLQVWCGGPRGPNKPDGRWRAGADEPAVTDIVVKLIEWQQMVHSSNQTQSVQLPPGTVTIQQASSPSDWYVQVLGGDAQYREHRRVEVEVSHDEESDYGDGLVHHINFNGTPVYQRSYTPPEVSFWAAATTYDKVLFQNPSLPPQDKKFRLNPLPAVHVARVLAAQAFKWVDPTKYTGNDINALWGKKGSAMRNAATSDVHVVYQPVGTWKLESFTADDAIPRNAPDDLNYEYANNGNYNSFQLPYYVDNSSAEHDMININAGKQPKHHFHLYRAQIRSPTSLLQYELGAELAKKAALLDERLEKRASLRKPVSVLDVVVEEASDAGEDADSGDEDGTSEAATDIQDGVDLDREPQDFVESSGKTEGGVSITGEGPIVSEGNETSEAAIGVRDRLDLDPKAVNLLESNKEPQDEVDTSINIEQGDIFDAPTAVPQELTDPDVEGEIRESRDTIAETWRRRSRNLEIALEDGRHCSPSKMVRSTMDLIHTPAQSPSKADDLGSWDLNESGVYETPRKAEFEIAPHSISSIRSGSSDQLLRGRWDNDDVFGSDEELEEEPSQTLPSSLGGEDTMSTENRTGLPQMPGKLNIDEKSPKWMPLVHCWKHIAVAVNGLPQNNGGAGTPLSATVGKGAPSRVTRNASQLLPRFGATVIAVSHFAIEVANWVFWRCMW